MIGKNMTVNRIEKKEYYLGIAKAVAQRSPCLKRHYGCIIVKNDEIIATGYNGSPRGMENCCDRGYCSRMEKPHNTGDYSDCFAVHAEQNAMLSAARRDMLGSTMYLYCEERSKIPYIKWDWIGIGNCSPCPICNRMIHNAGITKVVMVDKEELYGNYQ